MTLTVVKPGASLLYRFALTAVRAAQEDINETLCIPSQYMQSQPGRITPLPKTL